MTLYIFSHNDMDGVASAYLLYRAITSIKPQYAEEIEFFTPVNMFTNEVPIRMHLGVERKVPLENLLAGADLGTKIIDIIYEYNKESRRKILYFDHHQWESKYEYNEDFPNHGIYWAEKHCSTSLIYKTFKHLLNDPFDLFVVGLGIIGDRVEDYLEPARILSEIKSKIGTEGLSMFRRERIEEEISFRINILRAIFRENSLPFAVKLLLEARKAGLEYLIVKIDDYMFEGEYAYLYRFHKLVDYFNIEKQKIINKAREQLIKFYVKNRYEIVVVPFSHRWDIARYLVNVFNDGHSHIIIAVNLYDKSFSARTNFEEINLHELFKKVELVESGGHPMAIGGTLNCGLYEFIQNLKRVLEENL